MTNYTACPEDAAATRRERVLDLAQRLCFQGYPDLTDRRKARLWDCMEPFLESCLEEGATGWEENDRANGDYPCDLFHEAFDDFDVTNAQFDRGKEENRFQNLLSSIARTSFDAVSGFPGGVFGWRIGDLRRVYDGQIPEWFADGDWCDTADGPKVNLNSLADSTTIAI